jgi:hypothetical protein
MAVDGRQASVCNQSDGVVNRVEFTFNGADAKSAKGRSNKSDEGGFRVN